MIAIISPAKTLDFETSVNYPSTKVRFTTETNKLIKVLRAKSETEISELMDISDKLATLNVKRYHTFKQRGEAEFAKQAVFAFQGDVYQGLDAASLNPVAVDYAQNHLRILSGLYGLLRPLDVIQPYRLEMGTTLTVENAQSLYEFWGDKITKELNKDLKAQGDDILINLASNEYFKAVNKKKLKARIVDVEFKDFKNGQFKIISFFAKKARGLMARYIAEHQISKAEDLKGFDYEGYLFDEQGSTEYNLLFKRG